MIAPVKLAPGEGVERELTTAEQSMLRCLGGDFAKLERACFAGHPFYIVTGSTRHEFEEQAIYDMVSAGLLRVTNAASEWPRGAPRRPYAVMMTPEGEHARMRVMRGAAVLATFPDHTTVARAA